MDILIGIDAGGTTTQFTAYTTDGKKIKHVIEYGANLMNDQLGAIETVMTGLIKIVESDWQIERISIGMAGVVGNPLTPLLKETILQAYPTELNIYNDVVYAHKAIFKNQPGLLLSAGTGSIAVFSERAKEYEIIGGYGHLFGDEGSGFDIARLAIRYCMKQHDMQQSDIFTETILDALQVKNIRDAAPYLYRTVKGDIASLASVVAQLEENGNEVARNILKESAFSYISYVTEIIKNRNLSITQYATWGSVFVHNAFVSKQIETYLEEHLPLTKVDTTTLEINKAVVYEK